MLITPFVTGSPDWADLGTPDIDGATVFYHGLFGWDYRSAGPEAGGYGMFQQNPGSRTAAGVMIVPPDQGPPSWSLYFRTPDAEATAKAVEQSGGSVVFKPMDIMGLGTMAVFTDEAGAAFSVWQPARNKGLGVVNEPGSLCWCELYTPDEDGAFAFYNSVFGWEVVSMPMPGGTGTYRMINPAGQGSDSVFGGFVPLGSDPVEADGGPHWLLYFAVTECDATVAVARALGGTVLMAPVELEGVGRFAKLADPYGARFAVLQAAPVA
ncbi:VOC family protein [Streptomyces sp. AK02-01A]|uniref:VOC family protein n=1 Tax=Streptomyces sp. AK02-01A TaxID=3028648 RepID=UPI0029B5E047|nr:VOC family protein [Streptomyces sp. AK02-01A]MDX3855580.1 VOC family protein [Streptomyces sp. AK02-01A]